MTLLFSISAIDIYLPVISIMAKSFSSSKQSLQLTISFFFAGMAIAQLATAVLSDLFGRRRVLLISLITYVLASIVCANVNSIHFFMAARFCQGLVCGSVVVSVLALSRDLFQGDQLVKVIGVITAIISLVPVASPILGNLITTLFSWHMIFIFLAMIVFISCAAIYFFLPETSSNSKNSEPYFQGVLELLKNQKYLTFGFLVALVYSGYFAYLYNAPLIYKNYFDFDKNYISVFLALNAVSLFFGSISTSLLIKFFSYKRIVQAAFFIMVFCNVILLVTDVSVLYHSLVVFIACMFLNGFSVALVVSMLNSQALSAVKSCFGAAAGLAGFVRYVFTFLMGVIVASFSLNSISAVAAILLSFSLVGFVLLLRLKKQS